MSGEAEIAELLRAQELALLDPDVRGNREQARDYLAVDFEEFGASGRAWTRDEILDLLGNEAYVPPAMEGFKCKLIAPGVALVTYRTVRTDAETGTPKIVNRSSIWIEEDGHWRGRFYQGTPAAQGTHD